MNRARIGVGVYVCSVFVYYTDICNQFHARSPAIGVVMIACRPTKHVFINVISVLLEYSSEMMMIHPVSACFLCVCVCRTQPRFRNRGIRRVC